VKKIILSFALLILLTGCDVFKKIVYVQNAGTALSYTDSVKSQIPDPKLKVGDLLIIVVNATTPEAAMPFNLPLVPTAESMKSYDIGSKTTMTGGGSLQNYLIDTKGDLLFPIIGKIHALGMTKSELMNYIKAKIYPYYINEEPIISIRFANYKVSVLGEANRPGSYEINNEKINIFEAIALAGDLTIYGQRENILLIRENVNGKRETVRIDLRDARLIDSPYYYLQQNDVLYIQPNASKSRSSFFNSAESLGLSLVGTLISITSLIVNLSK
jgi:polysaccharide export outer membrane protein